MKYIVPISAEYQLDIIKFTQTVGAALALTIGAVVVWRRFGTYRH